MLIENDKGSLQGIVAQYQLYGTINNDVVTSIIKKIDNTKDLDFFEEEFIKKFNNAPVLSTSEFKRILTDQLNKLITKSGLSSIEDLIYLVARVSAFTDDHKSLIIDHDKVIISAVEKMKNLQFQAQQAEKMIASLSKNAKDVVKAKKDWTEIFNALRNSNKFDDFLTYAAGFMSQIKTLANSSGSKKLSSDKGSFIKSIAEQLGELGSSFSSLLESIPNPQIAQQLSQRFSEFKQKADALLRELSLSQINMERVMELQNELNSMWNSLQPAISRLSPSFNFTKLKDAVNNINISKMMGNQNYILVDFKRLKEDAEKYDVENGVILEGLMEKYELKKTEDRIKFMTDLIEVYDNIIRKTGEKGESFDSQALERAKYLLKKAKEFNTWVKDHEDLVEINEVKLSKDFYDKIKSIHMNLKNSKDNPKGFKGLVKKYSQDFEEMKKNLTAKRVKVKKYFARKFRKSLLTKHKDLFRVKRFDKFIKSKEMADIFAKYHLTYNKIYQGKTSGLGSREKLGQILDTTGHPIVTVRGGNFNFSAIQNRLEEHQKALFEVFLKRMASKKNPPPVRVTGCVLNALCEILEKYMQKHRGMKTIAVDVQVADSELNKLSSEQRNILAAHQNMIGKDATMYQPQDIRPSMQDQQRILQEARDFEKPLTYVQSKVATNPLNSSSRRNNRNNPQK